MRIPSAFVSCLAAVSWMLLWAGPLFAHSGAPAAAPSAAAQDNPPPVLRLEKLTERVYCLYGKGGNVGVLVTETGVVVVDDQYEDVAPGIIEKIRSVSDKPIRYLVNTHFHADHTGGNPVFIKLAEIIAHDTVRPRLLTYPETIRKTFPDRIKAIEAETASLSDPADPYRVSLEKDLDLFKFMLGLAEGFSPDKAAPPGITYQSEVNLWLGDQEVEVFHVAPGHTDGDSIVYFPKEKVLHMGDLFFNGMYPFVDTAGGGSFNGLMENVDRALARVAPDARVIPGHGPVTDVPTLRRYRDFLSDLRAEVGKAIKEGRSRADAVRSISLPRYPEIKPLFRTLGNDVAGFYDEMSPGRK